MVSLGELRLVEAVRVGRGEACPGMARRSGTGEARIGWLRRGKAVHQQWRHQMSKFTKQVRQRIIDGYLSETGRNMFLPGEFIDWLSGKSDHEAYPWFFELSDAEAAREHRIALARQMASGLRISVQAQEVSRSEVKSITVREFPAFVSPVEGRKAGGGYVPFDPNDRDAVDELRRQGATALRSWVARYGGVIQSEDAQVLKEIAASLEDRVALSA